MSKILGLFLRGKREASVTIVEDGDAWRVPFNDAASFSMVDEQLVAIDATAGVFARMGETADGRRDIESLVFPKGNDWTTKKVQAWLVDNGLDKKRLPTPRKGAERSPDLRVGFEHGTVGGADKKLRIEEDDDFWIIRDNVLTKAGVFNALKRPASVLEQAWKLYEGVPITHPHPPDIVEDFEHVAGIVRGVKYDAKTTEVTADYYLAKHAEVDGLKIRPENVKLNATTIERLRKGDKIDNSQGFLFRFHEQHGVENGREFFGVMEQLIPNHLAVLLEQDGACAWEDGCGLARLALERAVVQGGGRKVANESNPDDHGTKAERVSGGARRAARGDAAPGETAGPKGNEGVNHKMCDKDCTGTCATARELRSALEKAQGEANAAKPAMTALETIKNHPALKGGDTSSPASVATTLAAALDRFTVLVAAETAEHARIAKETAAIAVKLDAKAGKEDDLVKRYAAFPRELLLEHKSALEALATRAGTAPTRRDNARPAGAEDNGGAGRAQERHLTVGFRDASGNWTGTGRPSASAQEE